MVICKRNRNKKATAGAMDTTTNEVYEVPELVDNVTYHSHNMELETNPNSAYHALSTAIPTTTNEAYGATDIPTSPNTAYEVVQATAEDKDIDTKPNEAYVATGIATSVNEAYQPVQSTSVNTPVYDYARQQ